VVSRKAKSTTEATEATETATARAVTGHLDVQDRAFFLKPLLVVFAFSVRFRGFRGRFSS
jgi:hypothetical protein